MVGSYGGYTHTSTERTELNILDDTPVSANYYLSFAELELSQQVSSLNLQNRPSSNSTIDTGILNSMRLRVENNERIPLFNVNTNVNLDHLMSSTVRDGFKFYTRYYANDPAIAMAIPIQLHAFKSHTSLGKMMFSFVRVDQLDQ